jgi:hypothetical protein
MTVTSTNLDYLLPFLRQRIGDITVGEYRYTDEWLQTALVAGVWELEGRWSRKYYIDENNNIQRNTAEWGYEVASPPILQTQDATAVILQAAIIVLEGSLEDYAWHLGSWRDAEISYSNIQSGKTRDKNLDRFMEQLDKLLPLPKSKKLKSSLKGSLPGYKGNKHESEIDY